MKALEFIKKILPGALRAQKEFKVLPSLTIAQGILESATGNASIGNNIFGIKATASWKGKKQLVWTTEYIKGVKTKVQAYFRDYDSVDDSIIDHARLLTLTRYKPVISAKNYKEACIQVQKCGYATDPNYSKKLINIIETFKLHQYDAVESILSPSLWFKGKQLDIPLKIEQEVSYAPIRALCEGMGYKVVWNNDIKQIIIE